MIGLPDLPPKRRRREASVTPRILDWFRTHYNVSCAIEIKATEKDSIPASALEPHQRQALIDATSTVGLAHKLSDEARRRQPFDAFLLKRVDAYVVAAFTSKGIAYAIPVDMWHGARFDMRPNEYFRKIPL